MLRKTTRSVSLFVSSRRRHTRLQGDWSSDVCSSDLDLRKEMSELGHDLRKEMSELGHDLRQEMSDLRHGLELKIEGMRSEVHASASSISRQMYAALLGQMAVLLGIAYFFVAHVVR